MRVYFHVSHNFQGYVHCYTLYIALQRAGVLVEGIQYFVKNIQQNSDWTEFIVRSLRNTEILLKFSAEKLRKIPPRIVF